MEEEIRQLERKRIGFLIWEIIGWIILFASGVWGVWYWLQDRTLMGFTIGLILFIFPFTLFALLGTALGMDRREQNYRAFYKRVFVECTLKQRFQDVCFQQDWAVSDERVAESGLVPMGNTYIGSGYIGARYKDVLFEQANLWIGERRRKNPDTVYFKGRWIILKFPKPIQQTPKMKETLNRLIETYGDKIMYAFVERELHLAIKSKKSAFEAPLYQRIVPEKALQAAEEEIDMIVRLIEEFS